MQNSIFKLDLTVTILLIRENWLSKIYLQILCDESHPSLPTLLCECNTSDTLAQFLDTCINTYKSDMLTSF